MTQAEESEAAVTRCICALCDHEAAPPRPQDLGRARGNTARFLDRVFTLWKCPQCSTLHALDPVDLVDIYRDYALSRRTLDVFARGTLSNLLQRLHRGGLQHAHRILDFGCGNGIAVQFLRERGYQVVGFDPFVPEFSAYPDADGGFDLVLANDVLEHCDNPRGMMHACADLVRPGGQLYVGTADSAGVEDMSDLEPHLMRLHQPFHRCILTQEGLLQLGEECGLDLVQSWRRSYMDTRRPFSSYRFLDEFNRALGHNMDRAFDPDAGRVVLRHPSLLFWAFFGYWAPSAYEPAALWRKPL